MAVAIVLAAGLGKRMGTDIPKQFLKLKDKEILYYSLMAFSKNESVSDIILVTSESYREYCKHEIVERYGIDKVRFIIDGGIERYNSVYNGLLKVRDIASSRDTKTFDGVVMIHDGARPFVTQSMISNSIKMILEGEKGCTVGVKAKDTIKIAKVINGKVYGNVTPERNLVYQIQTPQTFEFETLWRAYQRMLQDENHNITDDTMLVEQYLGVSSIIIEGSYENIKITTPSDLEIGEKFASKNL